MLVFICYLCGVSDVREALLLGLVLYWVINFAFKLLTANDHRKGMKLIQKGEFLEAIPHFEASYLHFKKYGWVDKCRYIAMLSSSAMSYKELALCNIAFCYSQSGNGKKSIEYYGKILKNFPDNGLALAAMRMRDSMHKANDDELAT